MATSHSYIAQVIALWVSFLPVVTIAGLMAAAAFGERRNGRTAVARERVMPRHSHITSST